MRVRHTMAVVLAAALLFAGCSAGTDAATVTSGSSGAVAATEGSTGTEDSSSADATAGAATGSAPIAASAADMDSILDETHYQNDDLIWDGGDEVAVTLADGASSSADGVTVDGDTVTITAAGTYRLSGTLADGSIVVAAGDEDTVRIILDGMTVSHSTGAAVDIQSADEVLVYLAEGSSNTLTDAATYSDTADGAPDAALYSQADLTIAGSGSLTVTGRSKDGIHTKDGLVLASGKVTVTAADDGIVGKDYVVLLDGSYDITAGGDGLKSNNDEDADRGYLVIGGGTVTVDSGDDAIKGEQTLSITGGTVTVKASVEAIESQHIDLSGGTISLTSSDDGVNAAGSSSADTGQTQGGGEQVGDDDITISGGTLTVNADGDGLDSNGNMTISGGTVVVNGPTGQDNGALDVNGTLDVTGGTVAAAGSNGMVVTPGDSSTQSGLQITFSSALPAGTVIGLAAADGTVVATFVTTKQTGSLIYSAPDITAGQTYTVYTGGTTDTGAGLGGGGTLTGATEVSTVVAGEYSSAGMGGDFGGGRGPGG